MPRPEPDVPTTPKPVVTPQVRRPPRGRTKTTKKPKEASIESYFVTELKRHEALVMKFVSPGNVGVPDRLVIHRGKHVFVELKRPGGQPRKSQVQRIIQMKRHGADCRVISTKTEVDAFVTELTTP